jgi:hypothetical protein
MAKAATAEHMTGAKSAAVEYGAAAAEAAAMKHRAAATEAATSAGMETATAMETASTSTAAVEAAPAAATAMPAADFSGQPFRDVFSDGRRARIDQRKRLSALARCRRQHKHRRSRKAQATDAATDEAAPAIWNLDHA